MESRRPLVTWIHKDEDLESVAVVEVDATGKRTIRDKEETKIKDQLFL